MTALLSAYDLLPDLFSEKYHVRALKSGGDYLCVCCGRDTSRQGKSNGILLAEGGECIAHPDGDKGNPSGWMGWYPVGTECIKRVPAAYRVPSPWGMRAK